MKKLIISCFVLTLITSCASLCDVNPITEHINNKDITFGKSEIPCKKEADFEKAVRQTITAIYSNEFETKLRNHIQNGIGIGDHTLAWKDLDASQIVANMREEINGTYAETYGGIKGFWVNFWFGNIAYDGDKSGPIRLNRIPLKKRGPELISNTIAHEVAHRIGLKHPHNGIDLDIAEKEPPYVIGDIIEGIVKKSL